MTSGEMGTPAVVRGVGFVGDMLDSPMCTSPFQVVGAYRADASEELRGPSCGETSFVAGEASFSSLDATVHSEVDTRAVSPTTGFKLRPSRSEMEINECNLSGVPTVVQSDRRILAPKARHSSPLQPIRLFSLGDGQQSNQTVVTSPDIRNPRKIAIPRHVRQQKRDASDTPLSRHHAELREISNLNLDLSARPSFMAGSFDKRGSQDSHVCKPGPSTRTFHNDFFDFIQIGRGSFGNVYRCSRKIDQRAYAIKEVTTEFRSERERERILKEIYALVSQCDNINVVRYHNAWEENGKIYIQTELCSGTLSQLRKTHCGPLPEGILREALGQVANGLAFMHEKWTMVHLDIKPENIYYTEGGIYKLGDLGLASVSDRRDLAEEGDKRYLSREMLQRTDCDLYKVDIFALGVSIYELASELQLPSEGDEYHALRDGSAPVLLSISRPFQELVAAMMHMDPAARPTARELARHPLLLPTELPCLNAAPVDDKLVNVLPALTDAARLEWMVGQAQRLEKDVELLATTLATVSAEARRWEIEARRHPASV